MYLIAYYHPFKNKIYYLWYQRKIQHLLMSISIVLASTRPKEPPIFLLPILFCQSTPGTINFHWKPWKMRATVFFTAEATFFASFTAFFTSLMSLIACSIRSVLLANLQKQHKYSDLGMLAILSKMIITKNVCIILC